MSTTAGEIMDRSAVLMNDPSKTDYTHTVLTPFLKMALDELNEAMIESQSSPIVSSIYMLIPAHTGAIWPADSLNSPRYPAELTEVQEISERRAGSDDSYVPMKRTEIMGIYKSRDVLGEWTWENELIKFNPVGANTARDIVLRYLADFHVTNITSDTIVGSVNSRSFLAYKTAAYAAQFIGENPERAEILDTKAELALERIHGINNKGRQQMMTRHRPFRANWKMRGGF